MTVRRVKVYSPHLTRGRVLKPRKATRLPAVGGSVVKGNSVRKAGHVVRRGHAPRTSY